MADLICRTCAHWELATESRNDPRPGYCLMADIDADGSALLQLGARGSATLYTAPTFGCVLWAQAGEEALADVARVLGLEDR